MRYCKGCMPSHFSVRLCVTPRTATLQDPLSLGFSRQACWSRLPLPPPGDLPHPGIEPASYISCIGRWILYHKHHLGSPYKVPGEPLKYACTQAQAQVGVSWLEAPASYLKASQWLLCESRWRGQPEVSRVMLLPATPRKRESSREQEAAQHRMSSLPHGAQTHAPLNQALKRITQKPYHTNILISVGLQEWAASRRQPWSLSPCLRNFGIWVF